MRWLYRIWCRLFGSPYAVVALDDESLVVRMCDLPDAIRAAEGDGDKCTVRVEWRTARSVEQLEEFKGW